MTVQQLIDALQKLPDKSIPVVTVFEETADLPSVDESDILHGELCLNFEQRTYDRKYGMIPFG